MSSEQLPALLGGLAEFPEGPPGWPIPDPAIEAAVNAAYASGDWGRYHGENIERLENKLALYHGVGFAQVCCSGTVAVELALRAANVTAGDEVIMAAYDFKGNFMDVVALGATPVLVDIDPASGNLDTNNIKAAVSEKSKALIVSHLHGGIVPMKPVMEVAEQHDLTVIEDACQMPGARIAGSIAGTAGHMGILSFGGSKLLTAGRGGAVLTDDPQFVQRINLYRQRGNDAFPMSEMQAAILLPQLEKLDSDNAIRARNAARLTESISEFLPVFSTAIDGSQPGYYKTGFHYHADLFDGLSREAFVAAMRAEGVAFDAGFRGLHLIHSKRRFRATGDLPHATAADKTTLVLHHPVLLNDRSIDRVISAIGKVKAAAAELSAKFK